MQSFFWECLCFPKENHTNTYSFYPILGSVIMEPILIVSSFLVLTRNQSKEHQNSVLIWQTYWSLCEQVKTKLELVNFIIIGRIIWLKFLTFVGRLLYPAVKLSAIYFLFAILKCEIITFCTNTVLVDFEVYINCQLFKQIWAVFNTVVFRVLNVSFCD